MKEYLKMSKHFTGDVTIDYNGNICDDKSYFGNTDIAEDYYEHVCHATTRTMSLLASWMSQSQPFMRLSEFYLKCNEMASLGLMMLSPRLSAA